MSNVENKIRKKTVHSECYFYFSIFIFALPFSTEHIPSCYGEYLTRDNKFLSTLILHNCAPITTNNKLRVFHNMHAIHNSKSFVQLTIWHSRYLCTEDASSTSQLQNCNCILTESFFFVFFFVWCLVKKREKKVVKKSFYEKKALQA